MKVLITGSSGFLGTHVVSKFKKNNVDILTPSSKELDLTNLQSTLEYFKNNDFDTILHMAAIAGGIGLNKDQPAILTLKNLSMAVNLYTAIEKHLFKISDIYNIGTICMYPKFCQVPFKEDDLWNGREEETNNGYSFAKKSLLVLGEKYRAQYGLNSVMLMPVNLYGPNDNFDLKTSHVIPALIRKFIEAKKYKLEKVNVWGDGSATREFLYVEDCADVIYYTVTKKLNYAQPINIGTGKDISIKDLAYLIKELVGCESEIIFDNKDINGQPARKLDVSRAKEILDFTAKTSLKDGLNRTIKWYKYNYLLENTRKIINELKEKSVSKPKADQKPLKRDIVEVCKIALGYEPDFLTEELKIKKDLMKKALQANKVEYKNPCLFDKRSLYFDLKPKYKVQCKNLWNDVQNYIVNKYNKTYSELEKTEVEATFEYLTKDFNNIKNIIKRKINKYIKKV